MELRLTDITLRTVTPDDLDEVARMWNFEKGTTPLEEAVRAIDRMTDNHRQNRPHHIVHLCFAVFDNGTGRIIGWCGLDGRNKADKSTAEMFYLIDKDYRGRGYATACAGKLLEYGFLTLELSRIDGSCHKDNVASRKILENIGMQRGEDQVDGSPRFFISSEDYCRKPCEER